MELRSDGASEPRAVWRIVRDHRADALHLAGAVAAALPILLLGTMGYARRWVTEDAFIDLRVVRNLLEGHGPVFNIGERVEAYTNPLWVAVLAAWGAQGGSLEVGSVALGLGFSVAGLLLAQVGAWRLASRLRADPHPALPRPDGRSVALPLGAAVFAAIPVVWDFATSGLESPLVIAWLGGAYWLLTRSRLLSWNGFRAAAFAVGCGPLVRPDLALFSVAFGTALGVVGMDAPGGRLTRGRWIQLGIIAGALPVGYQVFRMGYFAALVPNTALAKEAAAAYWSQGWRYTLDFAGTYALWFPLLLVAPWAAALLRSARRRGDRPAVALVLAPLLSALAHWVYVTRVGGDFMHGRLLLPTLFALLLPVATVLVPVRAVRGWRGAALAGLAGWAVVCALWLRVPYAGQASPGPWGIADERGFYTYHIKTPNPIYLGDYLRHPYVAKVRGNLLGHDRVILLEAGPEGLAVAGPLAPAVPRPIRTVVGLSNVGVLGYLAGSDVHVVDRLGLTDPIAGRLLLNGPRGRPGHEKLLPDAWLIARFGDPEAATARFPAAPAAAAALGCGELGRLLRAVERPLTLHRFVANIRAAWPLHRLRIPADPTAARDLLCAPRAARSQHATR